MANIALIVNNILSDSGAEIGAANGVATLDSGGKIPVSQLPNSVMEFKGTWSAATNTPTLANGTGNAGDVYEVSAAGTVNFGAGGIAFALGDYVVYDGATWQYSSGQKGTVTSLTFSAPLSGGTITTSGTVSIPAATSSVDGYLKATDWVIFNGKQNALTNPVTGTGTTNYLPKFTGASTIGDSIFTQESTNTFRVIAANAAVRLSGSREYILQSVDADGRFRIYDQTAAVERVTLSSSGNVGIGTTSPSGKLHISSTDIDLYLTGTRGTANTYTIKSSGINAQYLELYDLTATNRLYLLGKDLHAWYISGAEKMRLDSSGNVGIGTTSPSYLLDVQTASGENYIRVSSALNQDGGFRIAEAGTNKWLLYNVAASDAFAIYDNASVAERLRISSAGNLLIGTSTDAGYKLDVNGTGRFSGKTIISASISSDVALDVVNTNTTNGYGLAVRGGVGSTSYALNVVNAANTVDLFKVMGSGAATFSSSVTATQGIFQSTSGNQLRVAYDSSYYWTLSRVAVDGRLAFVDSINGEKLTILTGGNVGIGTSSPGVKLDVNGSINGNGIARFGSANEKPTIGGYTDNYSGYYSTITANNHGDFVFGSNLTINTDHSLNTTNSHSAMKGAAIVLGGNGYTLGTNSIAFFAEPSGTATAGTDIATSSARMVIANSGNVLIGTTTDSGQKLQVSGGSLFNGSIRMNSNAGGLDLNRGTTSDYVGVSYKSTDVYKWFAGMRENTGTSNYVIYNYTNPADVLTLNVSNNTATFISSVTATSFFESSDKTIKTLIEDNYQAKGIESVTAKLYIKNGKEELGYYAQDLQDILPSAVSKGTDGLLSLSYREVHTAKIARLEKEVEELKSQLARL